MTTTPSPAADHGDRAKLPSPLRVAHIATVDVTHRFLLLGQLRRLRAEGFDVTAISAPGPYRADLEANGIHSVAWCHATRSWNPIADVRALVELVSILRAGHYDVVHTHNPKPGIMGRLAARMVGVPVVVNTVHGYYATRDDGLAKRVIVMALERLAAAFSHLELFQSEEDLQRARRLRVVKPGRSELLGNGVDLSRFDPSHVPLSRAVALRLELGLPQDAIVVGTVGRMVAEKGYREFFEAARRVRRGFPNARFVAIGGVDADKGDAITSEEVADNSADVLFAGWRTDVPELLALMDVFVLASWREGVPRSAIEAAAMGKALVLTDIRGCREVARDGVEGLLVPPRRPEALAVAIERLLRDPDLRSRLGTTARERALDRFDERRVADHVVRSYQMLARLTLVSPLPPLQLEGLRSVRIRVARIRDVPAVARLHVEVLPTAFLPLLGERFLRRLFRAIVEDPKSVAIVAERDGEVIGYGAGALSVPAFRRRFLVRHGLPALMTAAPRLVRPRVLRRVLETARYPEMTRGLPEAEFTFVGVKRRTARGLGTELARAVLSGLNDLGAEEVKCYVACDNGAMNNMMRRMGFTQLAEVSLHDGRPSNVYVIRCRPSDEGGTRARGVLETPSGSETRAPSQTSGSPCDGSSGHA
ncbi:MAG: glycosyltransferase [Actinomycetota bacterium]